MDANENITQQTGPTYTVTQAAPLFDLLDHYEDSLKHRSADLLDTLANMAAHVAEATERAVAEARRQGRTWEAIGIDLGISKQGAQQRYGR